MIRLKLNHYSVFVSGESLRVRMAGGLVFFFFAGLDGNTRTRCGLRRGLTESQ